QGWSARPVARGSSAGAVGQAGLSNGETWQVAWGSPAGATGEVGRWDGAAWRVQRVNLPRPTGELGGWDGAIRRVAPPGGAGGTCKSTFRSGLRERKGVDAFADGAVDLEAQPQFQGAGQPGGHVLDDDAAF